MTTTTPNQIRYSKVSASDVANYFISLSYKDDEVDVDIHEGITNLKLQKMLYFAQAAHLALHDKELFKDKIEAWKYGPVVPVVYHNFQQYKNQPLPRPLNIPKFHPEIKVFLDGIWELFDKYSAVELMHITHQHKPWKVAYRKGENKEITLQALRDYYKGIFTLKSNNDENS